MLIYFYQFTIFDLIKENIPFLDISTYPDWVVPYLKVFGLEIYNQENLANLAKRFLPHYASNLLSVLLLHEVTRIKDINLKDKEKEVGQESGILNIEKDEDELDINEKLENEKKKFSYFLLYSLNFISFTCKVYWLMVFMFLCSTLIMYYQLSVLMLIYLIISLVSFERIFTKFVSIIIPRVDNPEKKKFFSKYLIVYYSIKYLIIITTYFNLQ